MMRVPVNAQYDRMATTAAKNVAVSASNGRWRAGEVREAHSSDARTKSVGHSDIRVIPHTRKPRTWNDVHGFAFKATKNSNVLAVEVSSRRDSCTHVCSGPRTLSLRSRSETTHDGFSNTALEVCAVGTVCLLVLGAAHGRRPPITITLEWDPSGSPSATKCMSACRPERTRSTSTSASTAFTFTTATGGSAVLLCRLRYTLSSTLEGPNSARSAATATAHRHS